MKNKRFLILSSFILILAIGAGLGIFFHQKEKARQKKLARFQINIIMTEAYYEASFKQMYQVLMTTEKWASDNGTGEVGLRAGLAKLDSSEISSDLKKKASAAFDYAKKAGKCFDDIYTTEKNAPESLKKDFSDYKRIVDNNLFVIQNVMVGAISVNTLHGWIDDSTTEPQLYKNITLEIERLKK